MPISFQCGLCKNYEFLMLCRAYPDGIPERFFSGDQKHNTVQDDQDGEYIFEEYQEDDG